jgi:hypothetical protein
MAKKSAASRLDAAREALDAATKQITEIEASRNAALLKDDDATAARLLSELETLRAVARGHTDKIALLQAEAKRERAEAIVREHQALIGRFAKTLAGSDADLTEAADLALQMWKKTQSGIQKREAALAAFNVHSSHARLAATNIDGCALSAEAVMHLFSFEFYRISARPLLGGTPGQRARPHLPGARSPRLEIMLQPEKIEPFATKIQIASKFAVQLLTEEIGKGGGVAAAPADEQPPPTSAPPSTNGTGPPRSATEIQREIQAAADAEGRGLSLAADTPTPRRTAPDPSRERTAAEARLGGLLKRMSELAEASISDPQAEVSYQQIMAEVAAAQSEVDAEQGARS